MADREKVMRALSVCSKTDCSNCEYNKEVCLINDLLFDALALLKEQERIIKLYEKAEPFLHSHGWDWTQVEGWVKQE